MKEMQKVNWLDLTDSQKEKVLEQAKTYLHQQIAEAEFSKYVMAVLERHGLI